ncbi:WD domain containing protein [Metarhizium album ARSEF 1941]|uniref:WD domain containing protein n=1 Tax=Metarhizium album (strain ARSEF 1941) TaxID=1081103 RepID=A0A0B2WL09_METAS|nr:WD domain containing protein [Metarhizium album ARSEF 1941]KHN94167.1 WD domain containing protein [Metarhizium album ARSEF 1941]
MRSSYSSAEQSHSESDWSEQDEGGSRHSGNGVGVVSPNTDHDHDDDGIDKTLSELTHAGRQCPVSGLPVTSTRHDAQNTTTAHHPDANQPFHHVPPTHPPDQSHHLQSPEDHHGDDDEGMNDIDSGVPLDQTPHDAHTEDHPGSHSTAAGIDYDYNDSSDGSDGSDGDLDIEQDSDYHGPLPSQTFDLYPNFNGPPNLPLHLHDLYGSSLTMGTELTSQTWPGANGHGIFPAPEMNMAAFDDTNDALPPVQLSNPNPAIPGAENLGLVDFLRSWAYQGSFADSPRSRPPHLGEVIKQAGARVKEVRYSDLRGDHCDFQGLNWAAMETTRRNARERRLRTYKNYVNHHGSDILAPHMDDEGIPSFESFFRLRRMNIRQDVHLAHFQLRNVLACPSRTHAYYPSPTGVNRINTISRTTDVMMNTRDLPSMSAALSSLDAACGVLMGGTFGGDYYLKPLDCDDKSRFTEGQITSDFSGITNHVKIYQPRRSSGPAAAIASNDRGFRVMDVGTEHFVSEKMYPFALNCSALSPDHRLRVLVGDSSKALITNADTGEVLQELAGHRDYGFACDWSEDGRTVATGFQDRGVKIWDARRWCNSSGISTPLYTIRSEMASVRGLRFSPLGSGKPVLVAAEEADYINFVDAQTFASKQTIDVFGEIGGIAFANDGQEVNVLCCDKHRGGLLQLERCGRRPEPLLENLEQHSLRCLHLGEEDEQRPFQDKWIRSRRAAFFAQSLEPF